MSNAFACSAPVRVPVPVDRANASGACKGLVPAGVRLAGGGVAAAPKPKGLAGPLPGPPSGATMRAGVGGPLDWPLL